MINTIEVKNFKSIKHLKLDCKRINIFIGEPNTGKSNILESLGMFSFGVYSRYRYTIKEFVRFEKMSNLFYDENLEENVKIKFDNKALEINFKDENFVGIFTEMEKKIANFDYDFLGSGSRGSSQDWALFLPFKFYKFKIIEKFPKKESEFLLPPFGENLLSLLMSHKDLKSNADEIFNQYKLRLVFEPQENNIKILKQFEDKLILLPYSLTSDTLQRIIFYLTAIDSNKNSILIFEEPESHAFPYYTKILAERIAFDKNNQYFISTHNPYILFPIIEKANKEDIGIFITYFEDYQTKVKQLNEKEIQEVIDLNINIFFNIERFLEVEK